MKDNLEKYMQWNKPIFCAKIEISRSVPYFGKINIKNNVPWIYTIMDDNIILLPWKLCICKTVLPLLWVAADDKPNEDDIWHLK